MTRFWLLLWAAASFAQSDPQAEGLKALESQNYVQAAALFEKAVAADPKDYAARFHLALAYSMANRESESIAEYRKVLELKPGLYEAELNLGIVLIRTKQAKDAVPLLKSAAEKKPNDARPNSMYAEALLAAGDYAAAQAAFEKTLMLDPKSASAESGLARALAKQNNLADAAPHFRKAFELDPSYQDGLLELASLYEAAKQPADAIEIYKQFPTVPGVQERMGQLLAESGKADEAIAELEAAVEKSPTPANRLALAQAYVQKKQLDKAVPLLAQAVEAAPRDYGLRMVYGRLLRDQKNYATALPQFLAAIQLKQDSIEAWSETAAMMLLLDDTAKALVALDKVKALGGETGTHYFFRAMAYDKLQQLPLALENYQKFLASSEGKFPNEEFKARQRVRLIQKELKK
jgi:tetratricopeptide (TPR) repeat protein